MINRTRSSRKDLGEVAVSDDDYSKEDKPDKHGGGGLVGLSNNSARELDSLVGAPGVEVSVTPERTQPPTLKRATSSNAEMDRQSRIAANLARLDAAAAMSSPYLSKQRGYAWRNRERTRKDVVRRQRDLRKQKREGGTRSSRVFLNARLPEGWKVGGCMLRLFAMVGVVVVILAFSNGWAALHSRDPCQVSLQNLKEIQHNSRTRVRVSKRDPNFFASDIPKIVHQQWKTENIPQGPYTLWRNRFKALFPEPEYEHVVWTDETGRELIKNEFPWFLEAYDTYQFGIQRADAVRYFILYRFGGIYADLDYEPLVNFYEHLAKDRVSLVESPYLYNERLQNSLMSSPKGDPFWNMTFDLLLTQHDKPVLHATGPMFLDNLIKVSQNNGEEFYPLPCENFQRIPFHLSKEEEVSPFMSRFHRELLGRIYPMKNCGDFHDLMNCQYGRHHNTASYLGVTGVFNLFMGGGKASQKKKP